MNTLPTDLDQRLASAVRQFWAQRADQGSKGKNKDRGGRASVTAGKHLDGLLGLLTDLLTASGLQRAHIYLGQKAQLPGWYRAQKRWDLLVVADAKLVAVVEFKSQVGSLGNNANNRIEETVGSASDFRAAYEEGAFKPSGRPWLGCLMLLEDTPDSRRPVPLGKSHYPVFPEFMGASYARRYELAITKLVRAGLYDAGCLLLSGHDGRYEEPSRELDFRTFVASLLGRAVAVAMVQPPGPAETPTIEGEPPAGGEGANNAESED